MNTKIRAAIIGHIVGDALGVPVEFSSREERQKDPVCDMRGYGTHNQPPGTWSDDSSLMLCQMRSLTQCKGVNLNEQREKFIRWFDLGWMTPYGEVFDFGSTTYSSIKRMKNRDNPPEMCGAEDDRSQSNGALMRILPGVIWAALGKSTMADVVRMSAMTHRHLNCKITSMFYSCVVSHLLLGESAEEALRAARYYVNTPIYLFREKSEVFGRLMNDEIFRASSPPNRQFLDQELLSGSGYVVHCLESAVWILLNAESFEDGVLTAVNLGQDTDTTAAVAGGLLGLRFGYDSIPEKWINQIARIDEIQQWITEFEEVLEDD